MLNKNILKIFAFTMIFSFVQLSHTQEVRAIDNKGTKITVNNNQVTISNTMPIISVEDDIWFDITTTSTIIKIYNDGSWVNLSHTGTSGSIFFASTNGVATENNSQFFWDNVNNRLGVGTDNPTNKFHVTGAMRTEGILNSGGTFSEPAYRFSNDTNTGMFNPSADIIGLSVGGIEAINIFEVSNNTTVKIKETLELDGAILDENQSAGTVGQVLTATATGTKWGIAFNTVTNELIFDGDDDVDITNDNYRFVSLIVNGNWKVIRYDKTDVNVEDEATEITNAGQTTQPITLAECTALIF